MLPGESKLTHFYYGFDYVRVPFIRCKEIPCTKEEALFRADKLRKMIDYYRSLKC